jgi:hypothetical protein
MFSLFARRHLVSNKWFPKMIDRTARVVFERQNGRLLSQSFLSNVIPHSLPKIAPIRKTLMFTTPVRCGRGF